MGVITKQRSQKSFSTKTSPTLRVTRSATKVADHAIGDGTDDARDVNHNTVQNINQTGQQNGTQNTASSNSNKKFGFSKLPTELRWMVWDFASGYDPRGTTIEIQLDLTSILLTPPTFGISSPLGTPYPAPSWTGMATNTDSREAFLSRFPQILSLHPVVGGIPSIPTGPNIRFNRLKDTILMDVRSLYMLQVIIDWNPNPQGFDSVRRLATTPMDHNISGLATSLRQQQGLLEVEDPITTMQGVPGAILTWQQLTTYLMNFGMTTTGLSQWFRP
jgi:hypothetical protein